MSSPIFLPSSDEAVRREAVDPARSFTVRAPAGSGKTELLIQRYLRLLSIVEKPEAIVAITFTKKAAGEMLGRILDALRNAHLPAATPHEEWTKQLAQGALTRDREMGWNLLQHAGRLRVQTIDSLCVSIASEMPWTSRMGAMPRIEEDTRILYSEAAYRTLMSEEPEYEEALDILLDHLDNNAARARDLIASMLAKRDQWLEMAFSSADEQRPVLEEALARTVSRRLEEISRQIPLDVRDEWVRLARHGACNRDEGDPLLMELEEWPALDSSALDVWKALGQFPVTGSGWRKRVDKSIGFVVGDTKKKRVEALFEQLRMIDERSEGRLRLALKTLSRLPAPQITPEQWTVLSALLKVLRLSVAQLSLVFQERRMIDFCELGIAARRALKEDGHPTDLAYRLDSRIEHLLMDEFQDTSRSQFDLIELLTADWQEGDGRTLFLVGDPMQSIYRFRQAEVGLFLSVEKRGLNIPLKPLSLKMNYRSVPEIVERVNQLFGDASPDENDTETGAILYTNSEAQPRASSKEKQRGQLALFDSPAPNKTAASVTWDIFSEANEDGTGRAQEAQCVLDRIEQARAVEPRSSVAILVRARTHLPKIIARLKAAGIRYRAFEVDPLAERPAVRDVLSLTRALLHLADRISWLALLRTPWCGLTLGDLEALVRPAVDSRAERGVGFRKSVWECLRDLSTLSPDGQKRAQRLRDVFTRAFAEQACWPLRRWVERTWIALGGPAAISGDEQAREDVAVFFDLLEHEQRGVELTNLEQFGQRVAQVMERPPADGDQPPDFPPVDVMTIHKAKGLQFDTVILPGLGQRTRMDDADLVMFHEWIDDRDQDAREERLMAPISKKAFESSYGSKDQSPEGALYSYLKMMEGRKEEQERLRQLYVAMTRAKTRLHMMGVVLENDHGEINTAAGSMLRQIWPWLTDAEKAIKHSSAGERSWESMRGLRRLPTDWTLPELPAPVPWHAPAVSLEVHEPSFEWAGESVRHAGTVVHGFLQRATSADLNVPDTQVIRARLSHAGVGPADLDSATQRVQTALSRTFSSDRGGWIFASHLETRSEYALASVVEGEVIRGLIDRTFVDDQGVRWIVDFKTSTHEGGGLEKFLDEQQRRYRDQMERYARILRPLGNPVRVGLYFPLLNEWREWEPAK